MLEFLNRIIKKDDKSPDGVDGILFRIFDGKLRLAHTFQRGLMDLSDREAAVSISGSSQAFIGSILSEVSKSKRALAIASSRKAGQRGCLQVLPYESMPGIWQYVCVEALSNPSRLGEHKDPFLDALIGDRLCLFVIDGNNRICAVGPRIPARMGYSSEQLCEVNLNELFSEEDLKSILGSAAGVRCELQCPDEKKCAVEVWKLSITESHALYGICEASSRSTREIADSGTRERRRIGQDLHDSIGQLLTGISLLSRSLANSLTRDGNSDSQDATQISELADEASNQIRQISRGLIPSEIVESGLPASLKELARITSESCGIACQTSIDSDVEFLDSAVETHLYRIAQEAINNAVRHADAKRIDIIISKKEGMPQMEIRDDGSWKQPTDDLDGIGLKSMEYRATVIGGDLKVRPRAPEGTSVICTLKNDGLLALNE